MYVSAYRWRLYYICVRILLNICPHAGGREREQSRIASTRISPTTIYVSACSYICVLILLYVSAYRWRRGSRAAAHTHNTHTHSEHTRIQIAALRLREYTHLCSSSVYERHA